MSSRGPSRRVLLGGAAGLVAAGGAAVGARAWWPTGATTTAPTDPAVAAAEAARRSTGVVLRRELRAAETEVDLGGTVVRTWAFDGSVPGPEIRATAGDELRVRLVNELPDPTTVHWHGLALRNDMDGVPGLTMDEVVAGDAFEYAFVLPHPGTYWFHPHVGVQLDTGLQAPLIIEDPSEPGAYDDEVVLVLDDWTDGMGDSPDDILARMRDEGMAGMELMAEMEGMAGMEGMADPDAPLGSDTGDVSYPAHLVNGRLPTDPVSVRSSPGRRLRLRVINAGGDTAYRFAVGGHRLTVTHTDGFGVDPVEVDTLVIGMGERYDVLVTCDDGVFPVVAVPEGKDDPAGLAVLRTGSGDPPTPAAAATQLAGRLLRYDDLTPTAEAALEAREPDREVSMALSMGDGGRRWLIDGVAYGDHEPVQVAQDERVRLTMRNRSMMFHPMHVHGHTFAVVADGRAGIRKDTVNVLPMDSLSVDLQADNPGQWLVHCHNIYHGELGMMTVLSYAA